MRNKRRSDMASEGAASFITGLGCAPFLLIPVWIGLSVIGALIAGKIGVIIATIICALILFGLIFGGIAKMGRAVVAKTIDIECPYCETSNSVLAKVRTFDCDECNQRVIIKNGIGYKL